VGKSNKLNNISWLTLGAAMPGIPQKGAAS